MRLLNHRGGRCCAALLLALLCYSWTDVYGGVALVGGNNRQVGGVYVDVDGVLKNLTPEQGQEIKAVREKQLSKTPDGANQPSKLRMISLAQLEKAVKQQTKEFKPMPEAVRYLAGLQRIQYVFVDLENHDILLAGPSDGWKVGEAGAVIGGNKQPVLNFDDLVTGLRSAEAAKKSTISCSINPTQEGMNNVKQVLAKQSTIGDPQATLAALEKALGPQMVTVTGVAPSSSFARVLVAADYQMKRLGMGFEKAPVEGMPSYLELTAAGPTGMANAMPRWWLAPNYEPIQRDAEGLAYKISGSVKCIAEEDFFAANSAKTGSGKASPSAQKWADNMTKQYDELAAKEPVFAELRGCIDLAVVGALIAKENLLKKAGLELPTLLNEKEYVVDQMNAPKTIASQASHVKKGKNWLISVSGGVQIQPYDIANNVKEDAQVGKARKEAPARKGDAWWWN